MSRSRLALRAGCLGLTALAIAAAAAACGSETSSSPAVLLDASGVDGSTTDSGSPDAVVDTPDATVVADITSDFSLAANPNGAWTYGYIPDGPAIGSGDAGALIVFSAVNGGLSWYDPSNVVLGAPAVFRNDTDASVVFTEPGEFAMHPGNAHEYVVSRWIAPAAGTYAISIQFKAGDQGETNGLLLHNGIAILTEDSTSTNAVHDVTVNLAAGDALDVAVGSKGGFDYDTTPVHLTIRK